MTVTTKIQFLIDPASPCHKKSETEKNSEKALLVAELRPFMYHKVPYTIPHFQGILPGIHRKVFPPADHPFSLAGHMYYHGRVLDLKTQCIRSRISARLESMGPREYARSARSTGGLLNLAYVTVIKPTLAYLRSILSRHDTWCPVSTLNNRNYPGPMRTKLRPDSQFDY